MQPKMILGFPVVGIMRGILAGVLWEKLLRMVEESDRKRLLAVLGGIDLLMPWRLDGVWEWWK